MADEVIEELWRIKDAIAGSTGTTSRDLPRIFRSDNGRRGTES